METALAPHGIPHHHPGGRSTLLRGDGLPSRAAGAARGGARGARLSRHPAAGRGVENLVQLARAKDALGLASVAEAFTAAVAAVQRTDGALRLNVHFHVLALDGVYVREDEHGPLVFRTLPAPTRADIGERGGKQA